MKISFLVEVDKSPGRNLTFPQVVESIQRSVARRDQTKPITDIEMHGIIRDEDGTILGKWEIYK